MIPEPLHLLIVDDEPAHREAICRALSGLGGQVTFDAVGSLEGFRTAVATRPPSLAVVDLNLPDGRANEVLTHPAEMGAFPVLVMTAYGSQEVVVEVMKAGAFDYVVKSAETFARMPHTIMRLLREWQTLKVQQLMSAAVQDSESLLNCILGSTADGIVAIDHVDQVLKANSRFHALWLPPADLVTGGNGRDLMDFIARQLTVAAAFDGWRRELRNTAKVDTKTWGLRDGRVFECYSAPLLLRDSSTGRVWSFRDVTQHQLAMTALEDSEARFRGLLQNVAGVAVMSCDEQGQVRYWNTAAEQLFGYPAAETIGRNLVELVVAHEQRAAAQAGIQHMAAQRLAAPAREWPCRRRDGTEVVVFASHAVVQIACQPMEIFWMAIDLTPLKLAEAQLRLQGSALAAAANAIFITTPTGKIEWVNNAFCQLTGYLAPEVVGATPALLKSGKQDAAFYQGLWSSILAGEVWQGELISRAKTGRLFTEELTITPIADNQDRITHFVAVMQDITARKQLEAQYRQAQKTEAVGRLAGGVAHDINNMLAIVLGRAEMALQDGPGSPAMPQHLQEILSAGERSATLIRQLLAFARKQNIVPQVVHLNDAVNGMIGMLRRLLGEQIVLRWQPAAKMWPVYLDPGQIDQVLANLTVNARDAIADVGTITMTTGVLTLAATDIQVGESATHGDYVWLAVEDTGCGMDAETMALIFEPFFTTKAEGAGTGLGLATVQGIVSQNQGFIRVESRLGHGSIFKLFFPRYHLAPEVAVAEVAPPALPTGTETVLVVEDDAAILELTRITLKGLKYNILHANTPTAALQQLRTHVGEIQLLLTDVIMPEMNGHELYRQGLLLRPHLKCLFMSGYTADILAPKGVMASHLNFLAKPAKRATLAQAVRAALDQVPSR